MSVEWDSSKAAANLQKHGVTFPDAATVLDDDQAITVRDDLGADEEPHVTLGLDSLGGLLVVVYVRRGDSMRLIPARQATAQERRQYGVKR